MVKSSYTFSTEFINNDTSTTGKKTLAELIATQVTDVKKREEFLKSVRFMYKYICSTVTENVIKAIMNTAPVGSPDADRSDILVFLAIIAVLFGDSRYAIKSWSSLIDLDKCAAEDLPLLASISSFEWLSVLGASSSLDESQRSAMKVASEIMRYKGSFDGFISCIKNNSFGISSDVDVTRIRIYEGTQVLDGVPTQVVFIYSPYTQFAPAYEDGHVTLRYDAMTIYQRALFEKLEELRPAGVFIYYRMDQASLPEMNFWTHLYEPGASQDYEPGIYPRDALIDSVAPDGTIHWTAIAYLIRVAVNGETQDYTQAYNTYKCLPMAFYVYSTWYLKQNESSMGLFTGGTIEIVADGRVRYEPVELDYEDIESSNEGTITDYDNLDA